MRGLARTASQGRVGVPARTTSRSARSWPEVQGLDVPRGPNGSIDGTGRPAAGLPLSPARLRERGYNQAELLAAALARELDWPSRAVLSRGRQGRRQVRSGRADRARNVQGAFQVAASFLEEVASSRELAEFPIVLVDDVVTTGATAGACATTVEAVGLRCAGVVSFARTPPRVPGV